MTKQEIAFSLVDREWTSTLQAKWEKAEDGRTVEDWEEQTCICGNNGWCGRDRHRPDFAVDATTNETIW